MAIALAEACVTSQYGATIILDLATSDLGCRWDTLLFGEGGSRIIVSVAPHSVVLWENYLQNHLAKHWQHLGHVGAVGGPLQIQIPQETTIIDVGMEAMGDRWCHAIEDHLQVDMPPHPCG